MSKNTVFIYITDHSPARFFNLEGDYSHLDGVTVNVTEDQKLIDELLEILYPGFLQSNELINEREMLLKFPIKQIHENTEIVVCYFPN